MAAQNLKYVVFVVFIAFIFTLLLVFLANLTLFIQNVLWLGLILLFLLLVWKFDFILFLKEYERAVIMRFGKVKRVGGPGWCIVLPLIEEPTIVDLRTQTVDVPKQDVVTQGNIELKIDALIYLRVKKDAESVIKSVVEIDDYKKAVQLHVVSSLRDVIGGMALPDVIANTDKIAKQLKEQVSEIARDWGIEIVSVDIKDVDIPRTVLDAMHEEKAAVQRKLARVEAAQAHMAEINAVKDAAAGLSDKALAYYYIKALEKLGEGKSTKFIFPMELTKLAEAIGSSVGGKPSPKVEDMFEKYAPVIKKILTPKEKAEIRKKVRKNK